MGGYNTLVEAVAHRVPVVCLPHTQTWTIANLVEYGSGLIPTAVDTNHAAAPVRVGSTVALEYLRDTTRADVKLVVEGARNVRDQRAPPRSNHDKSVFL